MKKECIVTIGI